LKISSLSTFVRNNRNNFYITDIVFMNDEEDFYVIKRFYLSYIKYQNLPSYKFFYNKKIKFI